MVIVEKSNGDLRIRLQPRRLNRAIKREHYRLPTLEDIIPELNGATVFSKLDAKSGYWQLLLHPESSTLTFNTPFGRSTLEK